MDILHAGVSIRRSKHIGVDVDALASVGRRRCECHGRSRRDCLQRVAGEEYEREGWRWYGDGTSIGILVALDRCHVWRATHPTVRFQGSAQRLREREQLS